MVQIYRARCIPLDGAGTDAARKAQAQHILLDALSRDSRLHNAEARYISVALEADGGHATGLFSANDGKLEAEFTVPVHGSVVCLEIDRHFRGVTTVLSPEQADIVIVVVPGLAGHPYGSFKEKGGSFMWIIDHIPKILPHARVLLYGYKSDIVNGRVHLRISELGRMLWKVLELQDNIVIGKPYLFIAHSLGGLVVKTALLLSCQEKSLLSRITYGVIFFGVPNLGMKQGHLITIVKSEPSEELVANLAEGSETLTSLNANFEKHFDRADAEIFSFYETERSPILEIREGRSFHSGTLEFLVNRESATRCRYRDYLEKNNQELPRDHSNIVKFRRSDIRDHLGIVICQLERIAQQAKRRYSDQLSRTVDVVETPQVPVQASSTGFITNQALFFNRALFVERKGLCQQLETACVHSNGQRGPPILKSGVVIVHGMRGGGKSMLVKWFIDMYKPRNCLDYIFYLDGSSQLTLENDLGVIAHLLGWETQRLRSDQLLMQFISWQQTTKRWLLVIENASSIEIQIEDYSLTKRPKYFCAKEGTDAGLVIIVRESAPLNPETQLGVASLCINQMSYEEAIKMFQLRLPDSKIPERDMGKLAEEVGCHPLTIEGIVGYISRNPFENPSAQILRTLKSLSQSTTSSLASRALRYSFAVFDQVFDMLEALPNDPHLDGAESAMNSLSILDLLAFSDRRGFQERILWLSWNAIRKSTFSEWRRRRHLQALQVEISGDSGYEIIYEALAILHEHHLIIWNKVDRVIEIHPVVQMAARRRRSSNQTHKPEPWEVVLTTLSEAVSWDPLKIEGIRGSDPWNDRWIIHTHLISCVSEAQSKKWFTTPGDALQDRCEIGLKISIAMGESGKLEVACQLQQDICTALRNLITSTKFPDLSKVSILYYKAMNELGISIMSLGNSDKALEIREQICSDVASSAIEFNLYDILAWKANLAQTYFDLGRKEEALQLREEVLNAYPRLEGGHLPEVPYIQSRMDVADSLESLGRTPEALYHRHTALMEYLGIPTRRWNIYYLEQLLSRASPPNKIEIALLRGIAKSYHQFGRYIEALALREKLLDWEQKALQDSHPALLEAYSEYATTKEKLGQEVLEIRFHIYEKTRHIFSDYHPRTVAAHVALAEAQAHSQDSSVGIEEAYQLLQQLLSRYPRHHPTILFVKDRISQLRVLSPNEEDRLEALKLQQEIHDARRSIALDDTYDNLITQTRIADCYSRLYRHVDALNAHNEALQQGLKRLVAYKPGTDERQTHPLLLTIKTFVAKDYFKLGDPLCSCFKPEDTCNNILPSPIISSISSENLDTPTTVPTQQNFTLPLNDIFLESMVADHEGELPAPFAEFQRPLDGRQIELPREEIDQIKSGHMETAITLAREVLSSRIEVFSERHKSTIESLSFLAELLDFDDPFANEDEVERLETEIELLNAKMSGLGLPVQKGGHGGPFQQRVREWIDGLNDDGHEQQHDEMSPVDDSGISITDEHLRHGMGFKVEPSEAVNDKDDGNDSLFQDLSEPARGTKRSLMDS